MLLDVRLLAPLLSFFAKGCPLRTSGPDLGVFSVGGNRQSLLSTLGLDAPQSKSEINFHVHRTVINSHQASCETDPNKSWRR